MELYLSQYLGIEPDLLEVYGAFDVSVVSDLPLFIDPFLLFHSNKPEYQALHERILTYLRFLRDKAAGGNLDPGLIASWYKFKEVKQNWLGFTVLGNGGHGLGSDFAVALHESLGTILSNFGSEAVTASSHLEKVSLLRPNVGRDSISDFTTNLIKEYLLEYTQSFARKHLTDEQCREFRIRRVRFNYDTEAWEEGTYYLPVLWDDFVLLTPIDMLTCDDTWISHGDLLRRFDQIPEALPDAELCALVSNYFAQRLRAFAPLRRRGPRRGPTRTERDAAAQATIREFPELLDYYIWIKEEAGDDAEYISLEKVQDTLAIFVDQLKGVVADLRDKTDFYERGWSSYDAVLARVKAFKHYVENQDGWRVINRAGQPFAKETEVHLFFGIIWFGSVFDVNREPNNGRGPVDFKVSIGAADKSLIEFKLASNSRLKRNLEKQVEIYEKANQTATSAKVIICYTESDQDKVTKILEDLKLDGREDIIVIDARSDNKPSASKA
jgi:hypothetical protein